MKILIPTDYSENAYRAFEYAHAVYPEITHEFILMNAQNARQAGSILTVNINEDLVKQSRVKMDQLIEAIRNKYPEIRISGLVTPGTFLDSVLEKSNEFGADLIALGTKGASGVKEVLMGSNAADLIRNASKPLIVVPENVKILKPTKAVLAADFVQDPNPKTYDPLRDICYANQTHLSVLHVNKPNETDHFKDQDIPFSTEGIACKLYERVDSDVEHAIIDFVDQNEINLISTVKSKGGFIHDLFHSSLTKKLGMHADTPLLVLV